MSSFSIENVVRGLPEAAPVVPLGPTGSFDIGNLAKDSKMLTYDEQALDYTQAEAITYAGILGLGDTVRGVSQLVGFKEEALEEQQKLLKALERRFGGEITAAYLGGMVLDPAGWLIPVAKARTVGKLAWEGIKAGGIAGYFGYVDKEESGDRLVNAMYGAGGGAAASVVIGKTVQGVQKVLKKTPSDKIIENPREALASEGLSPSSKMGPINNFYNGIFQRGTPEEKKKTNFAYRMIFNNPGTSFGGFSGAAVGWQEANEDFDAPWYNVFAGAALGGLVGAAGFRGIGALGKGSSEKDFFKRMVAGEGSTADFFSKMFIENYGLSGKFDNYLKMKENNFYDANQIGYKFAEISEKASKLTDEELHVLYVGMTGDIPMSQVPVNLRELATEAREHITEVGQLLVDAGALSPDIFRKNVDTYMHRTYAKHLLKDKKEFENLGVLDKLFAKDEVRMIGDELRMRGAKKELKRQSDIDKHLLEGWEIIGEGKAKGSKLLRRDYTKAERQEMGEIENFAFALLETGKLMTNDFAASKMYSDVFKEYSLLDQKTYSKLSKRAQKMLEEGKFADEASMENWLKERIPDRGSETKLFANEAEAKAEGFLLVPDRKIKGTNIRLFGKLANTYLPKEIYHDLIFSKKWAAWMQEDGGEGLRRTLVTYRGLNRAWKKAKTVWNPTVHANNTTSNFVLMDFLDVPYSYVKTGIKVFTKKGREELRDIGEYGDLYGDMQRLGVLDNSLVTKELGFKSKTWADAYKDKILDQELVSPEDTIEGSARIAEKMWKLAKSPLNAVSWADRGLSEIYQREDQMFRIALYHHRLDKGMKNIVNLKGTAEYARALEKVKRGAAEEARRGFINYHIEAPAIQFMRETSNPFISYNYRIMPLLAETATLRPMKFAKWAIVGYGLNFAGRESSAENEEAERRMMQSSMLKHMFGVPFMPYSVIKLPDSTAKVFTLGMDEDPITGAKFPERSTYLDITRFLPGGDILGAGDYTQGMGLPTLPAGFQPSFGLLGDALLTLFLGQDPFTGKDVDKAHLGEVENAFNRAVFFLKKQLPNNPLIGDFGLFADENTFRSYSQKRIIRALGAAEESGKRAGYDETPVLQSIAYTMGLKIFPFDMITARQRKAFEDNKVIRDFRTQYKSIIRQTVDGVMSKEDAAKAIDKIQQEHEEYVQEILRREK